MPRKRFMTRVRRSRLATRAVLEWRRSSRCGSLCSHRTIKRLPHFAGELIDREGFAEQLLIRLQYSIVHDGVRHIPAGIKHFQLWMKPNRLDGQVAPVHVGHDDIREQKIDVRRHLKLPESRRSATGVQHRVSELPQRFAGRWRRAGY